MENLVYPLIVAAAGGLTFLAYKHPHAYGKLHTVILVLTSASMASMSMWNFAITKSRILAGSFIPAEKGLEALEAFRTLEFSIFESLAVPMFVFVYHAFLLSLPKLMENTDDT